MSNAIHVISGILLLLYTKRTSPCWFLVIVSAYQTPFVIKLKEKEGEREREQEAVEAVQIRSHPPFAP